MKDLNYGFIGCGLATFERAKVLPKDSIKCCLDGYYKIEKQFCQEFNSQPVAFDEMLEQVDVVFVCTPHEFLYDYTIKALMAGKHVLVEKPGAVTVEEIKHINDVARSNNVVCHVGYTIGNVLLAKGYIDKNPNSILANYCHGAREGYDKEWRMKGASSGGGVTYDLLTHITHMSLICDENLEYSYGTKTNVYWQCDGDDTSTLILKNIKSGSFSNLYASCADWKKNFNFALNYNNYKLEIKDVNARNGDFTFIKHTKTGPGVIPETIISQENGNFWIADTLLFLDKINHQTKTDLTNEINTLKLISYIEANCE